ncbi:hypothetical protein TSUD_270320 [Trifolium subterraneum]|uniref:Retrotransposon gag domain-containing protein n=1 Tax=Trifolium subterraneum TaxID=3900 RepID=A0A2Z6NVB1_TRISU|nr:hypothetical protein TSUD_270320 [Trifolium subterraneum]
MTGVNNHKFVGENGPLNPSLLDGLEASVTPEASVAQAQVTPLDAPPQQQEIPVQEDPLMIPQGAPMEVVMAALVNTINRHNELIREQNRRIQAVEDSRTASRVSRNTRRRRSPTPENHRSRSRSRSPKPAPQRNAERPLNPIRENPRRKNRSPPQRNNRTPPSRNNHSPPRRNNRTPPRNGGGNARHSPRRESSGSGDERHRGPLSRRIMDIPLPRGLEKPPSLDKYDGTTDPNEHIQSVETALDYMNLRGAIKCKLFPLSLIRGASTCYIERFNKVSVEVDATEKMKLYLLEEGLREGTKFQEAVGIIEMETLDEFFELAQRYIKWEEKQKASEVRRPKNFEVGGPSSQREERRGDENKREGGKVREAKPLKSQFTYHTPLKAPRDKILSEISNVEHVTDDCVHLKDAIEILIQKGYARQYVDGQPRTTNNPPRQNQLAVDPASPEQNVKDDNKAIGGVALAISRPEDFLPLPNNEEKEALDYLSAHLDGSWENFPGALVISGGGINPVTIGSIKRKFDELEKASPVGEIKITKVKESSVPLEFYSEEVPGGIAKLSKSLARQSKNGQLRRKLGPLCWIRPSRVQWINNKALGIRGPDRHLRQKQGHEIREGQVPGRRLPIALQLHHWATSLRGFSLIGLSGLSVFRRGAGFGDLDLNRERWFSAITTSIGAPCGIINGSSCTDISCCCGGASSGVTCACATLASGVTDASRPSRCEGFRGPFSPTNLWLFTPAIGREWDFFVSFGLVLGKDGETICPHRRRH